MNWLLARARYKDPSATLDDLRESLTTLEDTARTARRVLGGAHPAAVVIEKSLQYALGKLGACENPPPPPEDV